MSQSISNKPFGKSASGIMDFDAVSDAIAAARAARAQYIAGQIRSLFSPRPASRSLNDFMRASQLIAAARTLRTDFFIRLLHLDRFKQGRAGGRPKYS